MNSRGGVRGRGRGRGSGSKGPVEMVPLSITVLYWVNVIHSSSKPRKTNKPTGMAFEVSLSRMISTVRYGHQHIEQHRRSDMRRVPDNRRACRHRLYCREDG